MQNEIGAIAVPTRAANTSALDADAKRSLGKLAQHGNVR
jgi:hypothetical protein